MIYNILPFIIIVSCIGAIIVIVARKFPHVASIDVDTMQEEKDSQVKKRIVQQRLKRVLHEKKEKLGKYIKPGMQKAADSFLRLNKKTREIGRDLEAKAKAISQGTSNLGEFEPKSLTEEYLELGWKAFEEQDNEVAESQFIKVLEELPKSLEAYEGLATIYIANKDYSKAKETLMYMLKLSNTVSKKGEIKVSKSDLAKYYYLYGTVCKEEGDTDLAVAQFNKALSHDAKNPKYLDILIETYIGLKDVANARDTLSRLRIVNSNNKKIAEFEDRIDVLIKKK